MDVKFPTTDGRSLVFARYTEPEPDQQLILDALGWKLPPQAPRRITAKGTIEPPSWLQTFDIVLLICNNLGCENPRIVKVRLR